MTIDTTIEAIDALTAYEDEKRASLLYYDESDTDITIPGLKAIAAELKELREFVGAMGSVSIEEWDGYLQDGEFVFFDSTGEGVATGTDPFDAWRNMNAGEDE